MGTDSSQTTGGSKHERVHASANRLDFLDWTRGIGALIMLQGHVFHSFMAKDQREASPFILSQFVGGMPPAFFLFLTGVTFAFLLDSLNRKVEHGWGRWTAALSRARYLIVVAFVFRIQLWLFGLPYSSWVDLLKVDVLNCMGVTMALMSFLVVFDTRQRVAYALVVGALMACLSPLLTTADWTGVPELVRQYLKPDALYFSVFPWGAYLALGISAGSVMRIVPAESYGRMLEWFTILGIALIMLATYLSNIPYSLYPKSDFWLDSPGLTFVKTGTVMIVMGVAFVWTKYLDGRWSWISTLGQNSLPVYWVHIELVYGRWFGFWKESLGPFETLLMTAFIVALMVALAHAKGKYDRNEYPGLKLRLNKLWPLGA
jgi:uncharacterized membrane protein